MSARYAALEAAARALLAEIHHEDGCEDSDMCTGVVGCHYEALRAALAMPPVSAPGIGAEERERLRELAAKVVGEWSAFNFRVGEQRRTGALLAALREAREALIGLWNDKGSTPDEAWVWHQNDGTPVRLGAALAAIDAALARTSPEGGQR